MFLLYPVQHRRKNQPQENQLGSNLALENFVNLRPLIRFRQIEYEIKIKKMQPALANLNENRLHLPPSNIPAFLTNQNLFFRKTPLSI